MNGLALIAIKVVIITVIAMVGKMPQFNAITVEKFFGLENNMRKINIKILLQYLTYIFLFGMTIWLTYLFFTLIQKI